MNLSMLVGPETKAPSGCEVAVAGLTADSREVRSGWLFAALRGSRMDGGRFISDALAKGAAAILAEEGTQAPEGMDVPLLVSAEPRRALALMAARFYGTQPDTVVAVTGTSGKTSVADFARQILGTLGHTAASLGTIGLITPGERRYGSLTSPDPVTLHRTLAELAGAGVSHLALEASSHGLDQHRLDGLRLKAAAFTNLGHDHLDYHPSAEAYFAAKLRLFSEVLPADGVAVVNADAEHAREVVAVARRAGRRVMSVGRAGETLALETLEPERFAQRLRVRHAWGRSDIRLPLVGAYQAGNALVAAGLAVAVGEKPDDALPALGKLAGVKGRLEVMGQVRGGLVVVDYAHKPDALAAALKALRPFAPGGKLICVFGCGGDRDKAKRPIMGQIASALADTVIVTDDNPRSENAEEIRAAILAGAPGAREIGDRAEAILAGSRLLGAGDVLLVAGKGHETGQIIGDEVIPFSDHEVVRGLLTEPKVA